MNNYPKKVIVNYTLHREFELDVEKLRELVLKEFDEAVKNDKLWQFLDESFFELIIDASNRDEDHTGQKIVKLVSEYSDTELDY